MPKKDANRIIEKIERDASDDIRGLDIKALHGRDGLRLRVGTYRVLMIDGTVLDVLDVGHRRDIYR